MMRPSQRLVQKTTLEGDKYVTRWTLFSAPIAVIDGKLIRRALSADEMRKIDDYQQETTHG
jgi:hypothetical protein